MRKTAKCRASTRHLAAVWSGGRENRFVGVVDPTLNSPHAVALPHRVKRSRPSDLGGNGRERRSHFDPRYPSSIRGLVAKAAEPQVFRRRRRETLGGVFLFLRGSARLAGEWTYDAYGNAVTAASHHAFAEPRLGHKGLFIERLDGGVIDPATGYEIPKLEPGATTLAFARNRHLHAAFGRWLQEDPNATGQSLLQHQAFHGAAITGLACKVDIEALYGDGMSLVAYVGGDLWNQCDSMGLEFSLVGLMFSATNEADLQVDWAQQVMDAGNDVADIGGEFLNRAALDMYDDFDWASDWSRSDDDYSRTKNRYIPDVVGIESVDGPAMASITHHILTRCNLKTFKGGFRWTREFIRLFRKHGLKGRAREILNSSANTMELVTAAEKRAHSGNGHSFKYHMWALDRCARAMAGKTGEEAYLALLGPV